MPMIIDDFPDIAKRANLKALEGKPQNVVKPMVWSDYEQRMVPYHDTSPCELSYAASDGDVG